MGMNAAQKILWLHMVESKMIRGEQIVLRIDRAAQEAGAQNMGAPGQTLVGTGKGAAACGGVGMIAIAGEEEQIAAAKENGAISVCMPGIMKVSLPEEIDAQAVISEIARKLPEQSGEGWILEYAGKGAHALSVEERIAIAGGGYELGCFASVFPSDLATREFLRAQSRAGDYSEMQADPDAEYDGEITVGK